MADNAEIKAMIQEVAGSHGVALSPDDPLLIFYTIHTKLLGEMVDAQYLQLQAFKSELEEMSDRWSGNIREKAELVLNASLEAAEASMKARMAEGAKKLVQEVATEVGKGLGKPLEDGVKIANRNLLASALTIIAALIVLAAALIH